MRVGDIVTKQKIAHWVIDNPRKYLCCRRTNGDIVWYSYKPLLNGWMVCVSLRRENGIYSTFEPVRFVSASNGGSSFFTILEME